MEAFKENKKAKASVILFLIATAIVLIAGGVISGAVGLLIIAIAWAVIAVQFALWIHRQLHPEEYLSDERREEAEVGTEKPAKKSDIEYTQEQIQKTVEGVKKVVQPIHDVISAHTDPVEDIENASINAASYAGLTDEENKRLAELSDKLQKNLVKNPSITLQEGEYCHFEAPARAIETKTVITGSSHSGNSFSINLGHGMRVGDYSGGSSINRQNVVNEYPGTFYMTNKHFVLNTVKCGFDIPMAKVSNLEFLNDGMIIYSAGKAHMVAFSNPDKLKKIIAMLNECEILSRKAGISPETQGATSKVTDEKNVPKLLREYKSLYEDGVITKEEFEEKKKQLLNK